MRCTSTPEDRTLLADPRSAHQIKVQILSATPCPAVSHDTQDTARDTKDEQIQSTNLIPNGLSCTQSSLDSNDNTSDGYEREDEEDGKDDIWKLKDGVDMEIILNRAIAKFNQKKTGGFKPADKRSLEDMISIAQTVGWDDVVKTLRKISRTLMN
jgi:hypothetical protein